MKTVNKLVACSPYPTREVKAETKNGLPVFKQFKELTKLAVVFDAEDLTFLAGDEVFVRGDSCKHPHATEIYERDGVSFVLVPYEFVKMVNRQALRKWTVDLAFFFRCCEPVPFVW